MRFKGESAVRVALTDSSTSYFPVPTAKRLEITCITAVNRSDAGTAKWEVNLVPDGGSADTTNVLIPFTTGAQLTAGEVRILRGWWVLEEKGEIFARMETGKEVTLHIDGALVDKGN